MSTHVDEWNGDLASVADRVRLHSSRFHGIVVTAGRTYVDGEYRETCAYLGDPAPVLAWLRQQVEDPA